MIPDLSIEELARRYNNGAAVPHWMETLLPRWQSESQWVRSNASGTQNVRYGAAERNLVDVFTPHGHAPASGWPTLVFVHGGYWQRLRKDDWSVIAKSFNANGVAVAVIGYTLCPQTSIRGIATEIEAAIAYLWKNAASLHVNRERIALSGHSAGGHLVAWCMTLDWTIHGMPETPFVAVTSISGLFDLEPLVPIYLNEALQLTHAEALAMSPAYRRRIVNCPFASAVGGDELEEFLRQSALIVEHWRGVSEWVLASHNHFTIVDELTRDDSELFASICSALR
ncbi:MAG: alpha/beta hydrolase [Betaproteobacteria bacterium]|nr:MAG: alpha/beta hydrolase [Betaproteobacteria bacterium]